MPVRTAVHRRLGAVGRAPVFFSLILALIVTLVLTGTGVGSSQAAPIAARGAVAELPAPIARTATTPAATAEHVADEQREPGEVEPEDVEPEVAAADTQQPARTGLLAHVDGLDLHRPSDAVVIAGFHQASTPGSLPLEPVGERTRVLPSRGRGYPRTSAVDVVLVDEEPVRAPVTGRVVEVERYALYGRHPDRRVTIRPKGRSGLRVVLLHVEGLRVEEGDRVEAGETVIARTARRFPFRSQVDKETAPDAWPHVHLEVKAKG